MAILVYIPMTILACWAILILYDCTERNSIQILIFFGVIIVAGILTIIICNFFGLHSYESGNDMIERGAGPFRW